MIRIYKTEKPKMFISVTFQIMSDFKTLFLGQERGILLYKKSSQSVIMQWHWWWPYVIITAERDKKKAGLAKSRTKNIFFCIFLSEILLRSTSAHISHTGNIELVFRACLLKEIELAIVYDSQFYDPVMLFRKRYCKIIRFRANYRLLKAIATSRVVLT